MTPVAGLRLENRHLRAEFSPLDGRLTHLAGTDGGENLIAVCACRYQENGVWAGEADEPPGSLPFSVGKLDAAPGWIASTIRTAVVEVTRRFALPPDSPLLEVSIDVKVLAAERPITHVGLPRLRFAEGFVDAFEDERDLYFDGEELGGGHELPCWRVFFRKGYRDGLLAVARSKLEMSRFQILADGFEIRPHAMVAYDTSVLNPPLALGAGGACSARFEIGPWKADRHESLLDACRARVPVRVASPPPCGKPGGEPAGQVHYAVDFALADEVSKSFHPARWMIVEMPCCRGGRALHAGPSVTPPALRLDAKLSGVYRVYAGIANGEGITVQFAGDDAPTFRERGGLRGETRTPFHLKLSGPQEAREVLIRTLEMDGRSLEITRFPNSYAATVLEYMRFERLTAAELSDWEARRNAPPPVPLSGFNDIPDIAKYTDARDPSPVPYRVNLREHAACGIRTVYWRIDGQCSDYPSRVNTMRYVSAKVHGIFTPQSKAYGRVLKRTDMLALAVRAGKDYGLRMYGWMRFNNYTGNVQSDFYAQHPEFWEEWEDGSKGGKLCLAHEEVRRHKIAILVEAAGYGLQGLCLGFLRHPPVLLYAPGLVEGYRKETGRLPPRDPAASDPRHLHTLPERDADHEGWFRYRARFMTLFGRELKAALGREGLGGVRICIWVRPNHCLFDGIDLEAWLAEGLCDEVVADAVVTPYYANAACYDVRPEWKRMVQAKAALIRGVSAFDIDHARRELPRIAAEGYDGASIYESDYAVCDSDYIAMLEGLRAAGGAGHA